MSCVAELKRESASARVSLPASQVSDHLQLLRSKEAVLSQDFGEAGNGDDTHEEFSERSRIPAESSRRQSVEKYRNG
jgi:hypothetical protein